MQLPRINRAPRTASTSPSEGSHAASAGESAPEVIQDRFQPGAIEARKASALQLIEDPAPIKPTAMSLLATAWESLESVTRNLVGHFLYGAVPEPLPAEEAKHVGSQESAELIKEFGESDDKELKTRLKKAILMAKKALPDAAYSGRMAVLDTDEPRGSALPDGSILVSRGLMAELSDEELLFVVGHEMGHLDQKHDARRLAYEQRLATAKTAGKHAYFAQRMMEFYHDAEHQADDFGIQVLKHHGLGKEHAVSFHIRKMQGFQGGDPSSETHPSDAARAYRAIVAN
jgi:peptidase M48-like protein